MMTIKMATRTTGNVLSQICETFGSDPAERSGPLPEASRSSDVRIQGYTPVLHAANAWLSIVEARIRESIRPEENETIDKDEDSTEWLRSDAARAAIAFFRNTADLLPTEPHLYATKSGDLVAEFETPVCNMTSVVSDSNTILFGASTSDPHKPVHVVIRRGSNRLREELKTFTRELQLVSNGQNMVASR
jgi:hypothetical protein